MKPAGDVIENQTVRPAFPLPRSRRGFSLVELALAVGITSFCILTIIALLPTGLRSAMTASRESFAVNIGSGILADLKSSASYAADNAINPLPTSGTVIYKLNLPTTAGTAVQYPLYLDNGGNVVPPAQAQFLAILTLISPGAGSPVAGLPKPAVQAHLFITWPAQANAALTPGSHAYTLANASTDLRSQVINFSGSVELAGTIDLEQ
jgi:type II secretory pathway pseudopilin PulG